MYGYEREWLHEHDVPAAYTMSELPWDCPMGSYGGSRFFARRTDTGEYGWVSFDAVYDTQPKQCYSCRGTGQCFDKKCYQCGGAGKLKNEHERLNREYEATYTWGDKKGQTYTAADNVFAIQWSKAETPEEKAARRSDDEDDYLKFTREHNRYVILVDPEDQSRGWNVYDGMDTLLETVPYEDHDAVVDKWEAYYRERGESGEISHSMKRRNGGGIIRRVERPTEYLTVDQVEPASDYFGRPFWETWDVNWESCDCGGDYSCSHDSYPYEFTRIDGTKLNLEYGWGNIGPADGELLAMCYGPSLVAVLQEYSSKDMTKDDLVSKLMSIMEDHDRQYKSDGQWWRGKPEQVGAV